MYLPTHFREDRPETQRALIRAHPLGLLVTTGAGGLTANPVPFLLDEAEEHATLRAHMARANGQWRDLDGSAECLVVFQGPADYVTPSWYATKQETGRVVPTWNYATVQVWGRPRLVDDAAWLRQQIDELTRIMESRRPAAWSVSDAPAAYIAGQIRGIVGIEIPITRSDGKWKMSQNRSDADRAGVVAGFRADGQDDIADMVAGGAR